MFVNGTFFKARQVKQPGLQSNRIYISSIFLTEYFKLLLIDLVKLLESVYLAARQSASKIPQKFDLYINKYNKINKYMAHK